MLDANNPGLIDLFVDEKSILEQIFYDSAQNLDTAYNLRCLEILEAFLNNASFPQIYRQFDEFQLKGQFEMILDRLDTSEIIMDAV